MPHSQPRLYVPVEPEIHAHIKVLAAQKRTTMLKLVEGYLRKGLEKEKRDAEK